MTTNRIPTVLERMTLVEGALDQFSKLFTTDLREISDNLRETAQFSIKEIDGLKANLAGVVELVRAVVKASGDEFSAKVQAIMADDRRAQEIKAQAREKAVLEQLIASGHLVETDEVKEDTVVIFREFSKFSKDGQLKIERVQAHYSQFPVEMRLAILNQAVGAVVDAPGADARIEIMEIYKPGTPPAAPETPKSST
jgi:hypothetical protein